MKKLKGSPRAWICATALFLFAGAAWADSVTLHVIRSPGLNWFSPRSLARDTIDNSTGIFGTKPYPIGHVVVELQCGSTNVVSGIYQRYVNEASNVVRKKKYGLGVLFHSFAGQLEKESNIRATISNFRMKDRYASIRMEVSSTSCERMLEFHRTLIDENLSQWYGFASRPEYGEGGGCSAWVMAYLKAGGIRTDWMIQEWARFVRVPTQAVGGPLTGRSISVTEVLFQSPTRWAQENEPYFPLFAYDPDLMHQWARGIGPSTVQSDSPWSSARASRQGEGIYVDLDFSTVTPKLEIPLFQSKSSDPREIIQSPALLALRWEEEISIWSQMHAP